MTTRLGRWPVLLVAVLIAASQLGLAHASASIPDRPDRPAPVGPPTADGQAPSDPSTVLVRFRPGSSESATSAALTKQGLRALRRVGATGSVLVETRGKSPADAVARLRSDPRVESADLNYWRKAALVPNDPRFVEGQQRYLSNIGMPSAWDMSRGSGVPIAILDTGTDLDHPEFEGRVLPGRDFVNNDMLADDDNGHGTMVTGIAAAGTNNGIGVAGTAWTARILPVKVLNAAGGGTDADVVEGITWAVNQGAKVINLSLGGYGDSSALRDAVNYALSRDVVVVAAAGNDSVSDRFYPASYPGVVSVTATDHDGAFASFSNYGPWTSVAAPGVAITSSAPAPGSSEGYGRGSGTSFAAPIVSGIAALLRSASATWTQTQVVEQLRRTARDAGALGFDDRYGYGWVDPTAAVANPGPWGPQGGVLTSSPDIASWGEGRLDAFVRGTDNALWHKTWDGTGWTGWESLGGYLTSDPGAVSWGPNRLDVFVRGGDNALWHRGWDGTGWTGWAWLGGHLTSAPDVASWGPGRLDVMVRGPDNALWHKAWDGTAWTGWGSLGGYLTSGPGAVSWGSNRLDVFVRGGDNALWHRVWDGTAWSGWGWLGGALTSGPDAASAARGRLDVVVRGPDNAVWQKSWTGSAWSAWASMGGAATSDPTAVWRQGGRRMEVLVRGTDNALWHKA